jgi:hypothetical protein
VVLSAGLEMGAKKNLVVAENRTPVVEHITYPADSYFFGIHKYTRIF